MTIIILKKVTFELGKDVEKDVFPLVTSVGQRTSFSISMPSSKLIIFLILFISKHDAIDMADPSSMQDACHI